MSVARLRLNTLGMALILVGVTMSSLGAEGALKKAPRSRKKTTAVEGKASEESQPVTSASRDVSVVIRTGQDGLSHHPRSKEILETAKQFAAFRRGKMKKKVKEAWLASCASGTKNSFCSYGEAPKQLSSRVRGSLASVLAQLLGSRRAPAQTLGESIPGMATPAGASSQENREDDADETSSTTPTIGAEEVRDPIRISEWVTQGKLDSLSRASMKGLNRALRIVPEWSKIEPVALRALDSGGCAPSKVLTALGLRAEDFLPDERMRKFAMDLFAKSASCGSDEPSDRARYRLSLLKIWAGSCSDAEPFLAKLSDDKNGDYVARALYWRTHCALEAGNKLGANLFRGRLLKEFPLSYHGLVLTHGSARDLTHAARMLDVPDPKVEFRSGSKAEFDRLVENAEALLRIREKDFASEFVDRAESLLPGVPIASRLYFAVLQSRVGDHIGQFKTLTTIFREDPTWITRGALSLFYPLLRFEEVKRFGARVDPFLVQALIRQESGFNDHARSPAGALGLMQLMPATARTIERVSKRELIDPKTNIRLGVKFFYKLLERFDGDAELALAAYNAGPEKVDEWKRRYPVSNRMLFNDLIPFKETREYVSLIGRNYYWYLSLYEPSRQVMSLASKTTNGAKSKSAGPERHPAKLTVFLGGPNGS